ncbi:MAG: hypothetical protein ACFFG0_04730 [Candidatus Thorarchaeota archaeon]
MKIKSLFKKYKKRKKSNDHLFRGTLIWCSHCDSYKLLNENLECSECHTPKAESDADYNNPYRRLCR